MHYLKQYTVSFSGLKNGVHEFDFQLDNPFFEAFENPEIRKASIHAKLSLDKRPNFLELTFHLRGVVYLPCDLCLDEFALPLDDTRHLLVKFTDQETEEEEDVVYLLRGEYEINIAQYLYEFAHLALPMKRVHPVNENGESLCNQEMLLKLASFTAGASQGEHPLKKLDNLLDKKNND